MKNKLQGKLRENPWKGGTLETGNDLGGGGQRNRKKRLKKTKTASVQEEYT